MNQEHPSAPSLVRNGGPEGHCLEKGHDERTTQRESMNKARGTSFGNMFLFFVGSTQHGKEHVFAHGMSQKTRTKGM
ncbi:hypothetical protein V6N13_120878 [Hibiscus sabdariffa]|uniref:Uncharacterized protein n=1 Tax=Hibiscus sabdariffa TaxID=183260 RepID=A0ABR2E5I5_9ROSI